jgi:N-acetyl sugar amidotransferase
MDTSVPDILFNEHGQCNYCSAAKERLRKELYVSDGKEKKLDLLIESIKDKGKGKPYDCVIGISGGVDSSYVAYLTKEKYGLRPLAVHFDNGWNSELAVQNIEKILNALKIDLFTYVVDWDEFKDIQLSFLKSSIANCEIPTDHAILAILYKMAEKYGTSYIIHGGNLATESIMPDVWMYDPKDLKFIKYIQRKFGTKKIKTFPTVGYLNLAWMILFKRIKYVGILNYINFNKSEAVIFLEENYDWKKYESKHFESVYTRFFQGYLLPEKFKIDKRRPHLSSLIVSGQITRADALLEIKKSEYGIEAAKNDIEYIKSKLLLSDYEFSKIMSTPIMQPDEYPNMGWWLKKFERATKWIKAVATERN